MRRKNYKKINIRSVYLPRRKKYYSLKIVNSMDFRYSSSFQFMEGVANDLVDFLNIKLGYEV